MIDKQKNNLDSLVKRLNKNEGDLAQILVALVVNLKDTRDYLDAELEEYKDFVNGLEDLISKNKIDYGKVGEEIRTMIRSLKGEFKGRDGVDGYTPIKNKDYFDGRNPLTVSKREPKNPQVGDLWYQP